MTKQPRGIVVTTSPFTELWLAQCLNSLPTNYPILVVCNNGTDPDISQYANATKVYNHWNAFEAGGITQGAYHFDEFVHLMDTTEFDGDCNSINAFDNMFACKGVSIALSHGFYSYLGKYVSDIILNVGIPHVTNKQEAIQMEDQWGKAVIAACPGHLYFQPLLPISSDQFVEMHGRRNMVLTNGHFTKYKATWIG